ncbi:MAG: bifunctional metallophosphatase/5'-nucleotidase [bacterium]
MKQKFFIFAVLIFFLFSCSKSDSIPIIVTTDIHGAFLAEKGNEGSLAAVASVIKEVRKKNSDLILLDNGDILQGTPALHYFNAVATEKKHIVSEVMNYLKYDAATIGNHDVEAGYKTLKKIEKEFSFPWLSANITLNETMMPLFKPFTIIERKGLKIAVIGITTVTAQKAKKPEDGEIIHLNNMKEMSARWIGIVKRDHNPDIVIGLFHEGLEFVKPVIESVSGFDIAFTGHEHLKTETLVISLGKKEVPVLGASNKGQSFVKGEITLINKKISFKGEVVSSENKPENKEFATFVKGLLKEAKEYEESTVTKLSADMNHSNYVDLIHNTLLKMTDAELSITAPAAKDVFLKAGKITVRELFDIYPFDNFPVVLQLSGEEIETLLSHSKSLQLADSKHKRFYNNLSMKSISNKPLEKSKLYSVAMSSYHAFDGGEMLSQSLGLNPKKLAERIVKVEQGNIREYLFKH